MRLLLAKSGQWPPRVPAVTIVALDRTLGAGDGRLGKHPVSLAEQLLRLHGLCQPALAPKGEDAHTQTGDDVGAAGQDCRATGHQRLQGEVGDTAKGNVGVVFDRLGGGSLCGGSERGRRGDGVEGAGDAGELARVGAGELGADNVGVLRDADDEVGVHVDAGDGPGVVVQDDGERGAVRDGGEVLVQGLVVADGVAVVAGGHDEDVLSAGVGTFLAQFDGAADAVLAGAGDDGDVGKPRIVQGGTGLADDCLALFAGQVHGFTVGTHGDQADQTSPGQADSMAADGWNIEVFSVGVEEGHGGSINSRTERCARRHSDEMIMIELIYGVL